jgi:hypothetical protein
MCDTQLVEDPREEKEAESTKSAFAMQPRRSMTNGLLVDALSSVGDWSLRACALSRHQARCEHAPLRWHSSINSRGWCVDRQRAVEGVVGLSYEAIAGERELSLLLSSPRCGPSLGFS